MVGEKGGRGANLEALLTKVIDQKLSSTDPYSTYS